MRPVIVISERDNVATALETLEAGQVIAAAVPFTVRERIPRGHKVSMRAIPAGQGVVKYGNVIGVATMEIPPGVHVHTHNVGFEEGQRTYEFPNHDTPLPPPPENTPTFQGYLRADGRAGTRNYIAVVAASNCAAHTAELIARSYLNETLPPNIDGVVAFPHGEGCGHAIGPDTEQLHRTLANIGFFESR